MEIIWTKTKTIVTVCILVLAGVVVLVKHFYFPSVDEQFFQLDSRRLERAPANILIVRRTHFPTSRRSGAFLMNLGPSSRVYTAGDIRLVGRNASLLDLIAAAFECQASRVVLPSPPDTNRYDCLVTVKKQPAERLQAAIKRKLGYTARWQDHDTEVLQLKVRTPNAPGLRVSTADRGNINFRTNRLYFTRMPVGQMCGFLENILKQPVQDKTGLTESYDFSISWTWRSGTTGPDENEVKKAVSELGLALVSETETMQMLVVENAK
jgi:uncharacterized protein (TIGR03435 family)